MQHWSIFSTAFWVSGAGRWSRQARAGNPITGKTATSRQKAFSVLFYACCILLYITEADNLAAVLLAWIFVVLRYAHAFVHVTSNRVSYRSPLFAAGYIVLGAMWAWLAVWMAFPNG
jgi:hypothetical protein